MFHVNRVFPGITHITDAMGVSFTLIEGWNRAILFDTGYGTENVYEFIRTLTDKPISVYLSHGHHDHVLGARWFDKTFMCREDMTEFAERTGTLQRRKVAGQALEKQVPLPDDYMNAKIPKPGAVFFPERIADFESVTEELGERKARIIHVPGHTPGSIMVHIPSCRLLLTGDNWNPCTWMWFPTSVSAQEWRGNMIKAVSALEKQDGSAVRNVLCSHQPVLMQGMEMKRFLAYMSDERMRTAPAVDMGSPIDTHQIVSGEWTLVFDRTKIR